MKKANRVTVKIIASIMALTCTVSSVSAVTLYAPDGRTTDVTADKVEAWKAIGWFTEPVTAVYSLDGREMYVPTSQIEEYKAVGWYTPVTLYAPDGRTATVKIYDVAAWQAVGWFTEPVTEVQSLDGRDMYVPTSQLEAYKAVGWYTPITMYSPDGRTEIVKIYDVEAWKAVGWYAEPIMTVYAEDGRTLVIPRSKLADYQNVGWYAEMPIITLYAENGDTIDVPSNEVAAYTAVGWYKEPFTAMFSLDGRMTYVQPDKVRSYSSVGWYSVDEYPLVFKFLANSNIKYDPVRKYTFYYPTAIPYNDGWIASRRRFVLPYIGTDGTRVWLRLLFNYRGSSWVFFEKITGVTPETRYTRIFDYFDITRDVYRGGVYEYIDIPVGLSEINFMTSVANSTDAIVRFEGDNYYSDLYISDEDRKVMGDAVNVYYSLSKIFKLNY